MSEPKPTWSFPRAFWTANVSELFDRFDKGRYRLRRSMTH